MEPYTPLELAEYWSLAAILAAVPVTLLRMGLRASPGSRRYALLSLACGLTFLVNPAFEWPVGGATGLILLRADPYLRAVVWMAGTVFTIFAFRERMRDRGTGLVLPLLAVVSQVMLALVVAMMYFGQAALLPHWEGPWTYRDSEWGYSLRIPSPDWREIQDPDSTVAFQSPSSLGLASLVVHDQNEAGYARAVADLRRQASECEQRSCALVTEDLHTPSGWPCAWVCWEERSKSDQSVMHSSCAIVYWRERKLTLNLMVMTFLHAWSKPIRAIQREVFGEVGRAMALSLGPAE